MFKTITSAKVRTFHEKWSRISHFFEFLRNMWFILAESDILSDHADGLGSDVEERGYVLQVKMLNYAGTTLQQLLIALTGCGAVEVEIA